MNSAGAVRSERPNGSDSIAACHEWSQMPGAEWSTFHLAHLMLTITAWRGSGGELGGDCRHWGLNNLSSITQPEVSE